mmetsp:Transcript_33412/g.42907  ORF Transcript_33412/g.42907 Transcript_33412/m.42907 type:complete len:270 (-) Transcript_33412:182-991(-)
MVNKCFVCWLTWVPLLTTVCSAFMIPDFSQSKLGRVIRNGHGIQSTSGGEMLSERPPLPDGFYDESPFDKLCLNIFRGLVQREINFKSDLDGYDGLVEEAQHYMITQKASAKEQQQMVKNILETVAGPAVPPVYQIFMAPWPWAPFLTAFFTPLFFKFLVGPNNSDVRNDEQLGGVYVERCRFLEETGCKGLCLNMCKIPTQEFFKETLGLDMTMSPNYETNECRLSFGLKPLPIEEDPDVPIGCLAGCISKDALQNKEAEKKLLCGKQ